MKYFKNAELARKLDVSEKSVRNWIDATHEKKIDLDLVQINGKVCIADSDRNSLLIEQLVARGKKFRNRNFSVEIEPSETFYSIYSPGQVLDIAHSIDKYKELPSHYRYLGDGSLLWDTHLRRLHASTQSNMLTTTIELLQLESSYFDFLTETYQHVNIIDIGVGNGLAVKELIRSLHMKRKLRKYVGIDCSENLLNITAHNIKTWFHGEVDVELHVRDISHERFADIALANNGSTINIVLFLGGTIGNFRNPSLALQTIRESMSKDDVLITSDELDHDGSRKLLGFGGLETFENVIQRNELLLNLIGLTSDVCELGKKFDDKQNATILFGTMKSNAVIQFKASNFSKSIQLEKDETICVFRMWEWTGHQLDSLYEKNGFTQVRTTKLHNQEFVLLVSKVNTNQINLGA